MKVICRLFSLVCGLISLSTISFNDFNTDSYIKNISNICNENLSELPYWETIQDVFIKKYFYSYLLHDKKIDTS